MAPNRLHMGPLGPFWVDLDQIRMPLGPHEVPMRLHGERGQFLVASLAVSH